MLHSHLHDRSKYSLQFGCQSELMGQETMKRCVPVISLLLSSSGLATVNRDLSSRLSDTNHPFAYCCLVITCVEALHLFGLDGRQKSRLDWTYGGSQTPRSHASSSEVLTQHTYTAHIITPSYQLSTAPRLSAVRLSEKLLRMSTVGILEAPSFPGIPLGRRQPSRMKTGALHQMPPCGEGGCDGR